MQKTTPHHNALKVKCTMDEPIELLIDKLSSKSADLYVFWQNYNQMYAHYNEKINENNKLREEITYLKTHLNKFSQEKTTEIRVVDDPQLKQKLSNLQVNCETLKSETDKHRNLNNDLKIQNKRLIQQINQMIILINQLRQQNTHQKTSIINILQKLKNAQNQLTQYTKIYQQNQQKNLTIARLLQKQKKLQELLQERDEEIQNLNKTCKDTKMKYQRIIKNSMQNAKEIVMNNIAPNYRLTVEKSKINF